MYRWNKLTTLSLIFTMLLSVFTGCVNTHSNDTVSYNTSEKIQDMETPDDSSAVENSGMLANGKKITLTTISMFGGTDPSAETYNRVIEEFQAAYTNITISDISTSADEEWKTKIAADFSVGNEPDVLQFFTDATANAIVATGKLVSLEEIRSEYPEYAADTLDSALEAVKNTDGMQRAVPTTGYWEGLFINRDLFIKYNVEIPTDWESLVTAIEIFKANDIIPIACSLNEVPHYWIEYLMLYSAGAEEYTNIPKSAPKTWVKGLELFQTLREMGAFPEDTDTVDDAYIRQLFNRKEAAMQLDGNWRMSSIEDQENVEIINFPGVPDQKAEAGTIISGLSSGFYITRKAWEDADKREAAVRFVMAQTSKESLECYWDGNGVPTYAADSLEDPTPLVASGYAYSQSATNVIQPTDARIDGESYKQIVAGIVSISVGSRSAEDILNQALKLNMQRSIE